MMRPPLPLPLDAKQQWAPPGPRCARRAQRQKWGGGEAALRTVTRARAGRYNGARAGERVELCRMCRAAGHACTHALGGVDTCTLTTACCLCGGGRTLHIYRCTRMRMHVHAHVHACTRTASSLATARSACGPGSLLRPAWGPLPPCHRRSNTEYTVARMPAWRHTWCSAQTHTRGAVAYHRRPVLGLLVGSTHEAAPAYQPHVPGPPSARAYMYVHGAPPFGPPAARIVLAVLQG